MLELVAQFLEHTMIIWTIYDLAILAGIFLVALMIREIAQAIRDRPAQ